MTEPTNEIAKWARLAAAGADAKLARDTIIIDIGEVFAVSDYFVITTGTSNRQVRAIVDGVEEFVAAAGGPRPVRVEGREEREWVLMDYGSFVVHVFHQEQRDFYQLEKLWGDRPRVNWEPQQAPEVG